MKFTIHNGNSLEVLKQYPDNYFDSVVTDPPYGLGKPPDINEVLSAWIKGENFVPKGKGFMNKEWDAFVPGPEIWKEVFRVLKPGGHLLAFFGTRTYDIGTLAIRMSGFEIRDQIAWIYGCYSEDTECLTKTGWKHYSQLSLEDEILQWNDKTNELTWIKPKQIFVYDAPKTMIHIQNRHTDQLLTTNHTVIAKIKKHSRNPKSNIFEKIKAGSIKGHWQLDYPMAGQLKTGITENRAYLIGWWLTDACVHQDGKACVFYQSKPKTLEKLKNALNQSDCIYSEYVNESKNKNHNNSHVFYVRGNDADFLLKNFKNRELTWDVLGWDYNSRYALLEGLLDGDGSRQTKQYAETFWSIKKDRLDIVQALCVSLNIRCHIEENSCVYLNRKTNTTQTQNKHILKEISYQGNKVWCLETDTGAFVVRRNNRPFISGNSGFPKSHDVSKAIDKHFNVEREKVRVDASKVSNPKATGGGKDGMEGASRPWIKKALEVGYHEKDSDIPVSEEAKKWQGWGTGLKPAMEPIVVARKPLEEKTVAENVLKYGTGAINIDESRIKGAGNTSIRGSSGLDTNIHQGWARPWMEDREKVKQRIIDVTERTNTLGRWPSNLIHDGSDEVVNLFPNSKSIRCVRTSKPGKIYGGGQGLPSHTGEYGFNDSGSAVRFFYSAKTSKSDREEGLDSFTEKNTAASEFRPNHMEKAEAGENGSAYGRFTPLKNNHPTVKNTSLMEYLVTLVTPPGGIVLDPFMGSGSTGKACMNKGFEFVGIDLDEEYCKIAKARISFALEKKTPKNSLLKKGKKIES